MSRSGSENSDHSSVRDDESEQSPPSAAEAESFVDSSEDNDDEEEEEEEEETEAESDGVEKKRQLFFHPAVGSLSSAKDEDPEPESKVNPAEFRSRLSRFFAYYEPSQLGALDQWMSNWKGRLNKLMAELIRYHGPEPSLGESGPVVKTQARSTIAQVIQRCRELLMQFYFLYAPDQVVEVDKTILTWKGQEPALLARLQRQARLRDFVIHQFRENYPDRMQEVPGILREWFGAESELVKCLRRDKSFPPSKAKLRQVRDNTSAEDADPTSDPVPMPFRSWREQLLFFYSVHNPERATTVDYVLDEYKGREATLFRKLIRKYTGVDVLEKEILQGRFTATLAKQGGLVPEEGGEEQSEMSQVPSPIMPGVISLTKRMDENSKHKIRLLCAAWKPDIAREVGDLLEKFDGTEAQLMSRLVLAGSRDEESSSREEEGEEEEEGAGSATMKLTRKPIVTVEAFRRRKLTVNQLSAEDVLFPRVEVSTQTLQAEMDPVQHLEDQINTNRQRQVELNETLNSLRHRPLDVRLEGLPPPGMLLGNSERPQAPIGANLPELAGLGAELPSAGKLLGTVQQKHENTSGNHHLSLWLAQNNLGHLYKVFLDAEIVLSCIPALTRIDLEQLGISTGDQRKVMTAAAML